MDGVFRELRKFLRVLLRHWFSKFLLLLGFGSTLATYIASFRAGFAVPPWLPLIFFFAALLWGSFDLFRALTAEIEHLGKENAAYKSQNAALEGNAAAKDGKVLADLISEVEGNLRTAQAHYSGPPGNRVYLSPSVDCWKRVRNALDFLDLGIRKEVEEIYRQIERWHGIVASGLNPGIGNPEIPEITQNMKRDLPEILRKLKSLPAALSKK